MNFGESKSLETSRTFRESLKSDVSMSKCQFSKFIMIFLKKQLLAFQIDSKPQKSVKEVKKVIKIRQTVTGKC